MLRFKPKYFLFPSSLGDLTEGPRGVREFQHEPAVEIGKTQKDTELSESGWGWLILNYLDRGWIEMNPVFINNVS